SRPLPHTPAGCGSAPVAAPAAPICGPQSPRRRASGRAVAERTAPQSPAAQSSVPTQFRRQGTAPPSPLRCSWPAARSFCVRRCALLHAPSTCERPGSAAPPPAPGASGSPARSAAASVRLHATPDTGRTNPPLPGTPALHRPETQVVRCPPWDRSPPPHPARPAFSHTPASDASARAATVPAAEICAQAAPRSRPPVSPSRLPSPALRIPPQRLYCGCASCCELFVLDCPAFAPLSAFGPTESSGGGSPGSVNGFFSPLSAASFVSG